jgi:hypothetical protein
MASDQTSRERLLAWAAHWHSIRASALMPGLEFYELRHRALQWMIDPPEDGGLGLDIQTAARMAGHSDGGYLLCSTYTKLTQHQAHTRAQSAMDTYQQHLESPKTCRKSDSRWVVALQKNPALAAIDLQTPSTAACTLHAQHPQESPQFAVFSSPRSRFEPATLPLPSKQ